MRRATLIFGAGALWLAGFAVSVVTIIPLSVMGLTSIFNRNFSVLERLQALGFTIAGLIVVALLFATLTRILRLFTKAPHAQD